LVKPEDVILEMNYCPRCAHPLEDRFLFGRTRRACPGCGFIFFQDHKVATGVLVEQDGEVLLVRRAVDPKQGWWCIPSGFVEYDEAPEEAAIRECEEETGLDVRLTGLLDVYHYRSDFRGSGILIVYRAKVVGGELRPGDDASEARFFGPAELPQEIAFASNREALRRWQQRVQTQEVTKARSGSPDPLPNCWIARSSRSELGSTESQEIDQV
jgi:ADP-ribose pyrophosphatase YjhB (NUDIX family)